MTSTTQYEGQVAVITGGAQGIGFAVAQRLLAGGAKVCLWDADAAALQVAAEQLKGQPVQTVQVDITDLPAVEAAVKATESDSGPIAILSTVPASPVPTCRWPTIRRPSGSG